tara:strand:- start:789 stop:1682 length:894 start_codon:yes stop_codon:yes gene_type:complete
MKPFVTETNVLEDVYKICNLPYTQKFLGPQPISIERKHLKKLNSNYYISNKCDGLRFLIVILVINNKPRCVLINRNLQLFLINMSIKKPYYEGSVFDCELIINNDNKKEFLFFDCICSRGTPYKALSYSERIAKCNEFLKECNPRESDEYVFSTKQIFHLTDIDSFRKSLNTLNYKHDGYILMPDNKEIIVGTHSTMFKWKPCYKNTIDFKVDDKLKLYLYKNGELSKTLNKLTFENSMLVEDDVKSSIVECEFISKRLWKPLQVRKDKNTPNGIFTFNKTLVNIEEDIQPEEFNLF